MIEGIRSVLVALTKEFGGERASCAIAYGLSLAGESGASLTVQAASQSLRLASAGVSRIAAGLVGAENARLQKLAEQAVAAVEADAAAAGVIAHVRAPHLPWDAMIASFGELARVSDLTVIDAEPEAIHPDRELLRALLVQSGRPLLVVPPGHERFASGRVLVAWDGSGRAARAAHDALPFLRAAERVQIVSVTGEKELGSSAEGSDLAAHLARHGVAVEVNRIAAPGGDAARALREAAGAFGAEMIVMGGFVHSPLRQLVFGGVTQSLLRDSPVPLLLSH